MRTLVAVALTALVVGGGTILYYENLDITCIAGELAILGGTMAVDAAVGNVSSLVENGGAVLEQGGELIDGAQEHVLEGADAVAERIRGAAGFLQGE